MKQDFNESLLSFLNKILTKVMQYLSNSVVCRPQLYIHGEAVAVNICIRNHSNKVVKKIKASILQTVDVVLFQNGQYRNVVTGVETQ